MYLCDENTVYLVKSELWWIFSRDAHGNVRPGMTDWIPEKKKKNNN